MTRPEPTGRPLDPRVFRLRDGAPVFLASRCSACREIFFPRRQECAICLGPLGDLELGDTGSLYSHTFVAVPMYGKSMRHSEGYGVGLIDLDDGVRVLGLLGGDPAEWRIGSRFRVEPQPVPAAIDSDPMVTYRFVPCAQ